MPSAHSRSRNARKPQRRRQRSYDTVPMTPEEVDGATSGQTSSSDVSDEDDNFQHQRGSGPTSEHRYGSAVRPRRTPEDVGQALSGRTFHESDELDVIIYTFADEVCLEDQIHIKSLVELDDFFRNSQTSAAKHDFLVLIEDISDKIAQVIDQYSKTNQDTAKEHVRGRVNGKERLGTRSLHSDRLHTTLFDHYGRDENRDSLTWWRLFSHSRNGYTREKEALDGCDADTRRVTVPHFELQISDTHQGKIPTKTDLRDLGMRATLSHQWSEVRKKARNTQPSKDDDKPSTGSGPDPEILQFKVNTYRIIPHTYRPHQVITETSDDMWGAAGEERITCNWFENNDSTYYILLFDKPRTYRHIIQNFRHGEATEFNPGEPILSYEEPSDVLPTFLSAEALPNKKPKLPRTKTPIAAGGIYRHVASVASTNRSPAPRRRKQLDRATANLRQDSLEELPSQEPTSQLPVSTRSRFIEEATRAGLLRQSKSVAQERDQVLHRVRLAFAKMAAEDWNLVLSQMALTLDDIDAKMSDNTLLQTNALAWRRLLCSWRVSLVEYATRLLEIKTKLQPLQTTDASLFESTTRASEVIGARTDTTILEEEQKLLQLYQILVDGLHKIEQRVDRSFQAIMSSMSILESEKAIAQGAAITRLTELAFFFIPLSFAATFFSMQIQEYDLHQPHMGHFFAMGISLLVFLYTMRAAIRSTILTKYKSKLKTEIRQTSRVPGTEDIPTRIIASYVWQRLGSLTQTIIIVLPFMVFTLVLVASQGHGLVFRTIALIIVVLGAATVAIFLIAKRFLAAIRTSIITVWLLSIVGACIGGKTRPNPGVLGTICVVVTTVCGIILALVPQNLIQRVWKRTTQVLLPLWLVLLPFTIMLNYYLRDHWRPYQLILGSLTVIIVFGLISGFLYGKAIRWLPQICGLCALVLGIPLTLAWTVWPMAEDANEQTRWVHLPREVSIAMSAFAGALFLVLAPALTSRRYRWSDVWWHASCFIVLFALPITLVWYLLPYNGRQLPLFAKIAVTAGAAVVCPIAAVSGWLSSPPPRIRFLSIASIVVALPVTFVWAVTPLPNIPDISLQAKISVTLGSVMVLSLLLRMLFIFSSEGWRLLAWTMSGAAMMSWIPLLVWVTDWKVFEHVRKRRTIAIHVSWATSVAILVVWMVLWKKFFSISRTWIPNLSGRRRRKNDRLLGLAY